MEIEDHGQGFDVHQAPYSGRVGLASMSERAAEIGWTLQIISSLGAGTCIRVERYRIEVSLAPINHRQQEGEYGISRV